MREAFTGESGLLGIQPIGAIDESDPGAASDEWPPTAGSDRGGGPTVTSRSSDANADDTPTDHLDDVEDGCGCAEVWEHLSEHRESSEES